MLEINTEWYEAIKDRISTRKFKGVQLEDAVNKQLLEFTKTLNAIETGYRIEYINKRCDDLFKGIIGSYGKISPSPAFAVVIQDTRDSDSLTKMGYYGEAFVLEATRLGLGSCWVSGTFEPDQVKQYITLKDSEHLQSIIPVGYIEKDKTFRKSLMKMAIKPHKRKAITQVCQGYHDQLDPWIKDALEMARLAPSAVNKQPWRFDIKTDTIRIYIEEESKDKRLSRRLDCGIAMLHFEIGANTYGKTNRWSYLDKPDVGLYKF